MSRKSWLLVPSYRFVKPANGHAFDYWAIFPLVVLGWWMGWLGTIDFSPYFLGVFAGLSMADAIHAAADFLPAKRKRFITNSQRRHVGGD